MKKLLFLVSSFLLLTGCGTSKLLNTPTKKVEMFFGKYQSLDQDVIDQLNDVSENEMIFNDDQKEEYINLMKKHYKEIKYDVKDETIDGDTATVTVEIEVRDYSKIMNDADQYLKDILKNFIKKVLRNMMNPYLSDYRLEKLKDATDKVKYTIDLSLTKIEDEWVIDV